jgi:hypothetical protein
MAIKHIEIAIGELGKQEMPIGSNWGEHVKKYLASVGIYFPASWCMAFAYWCVQESKELNHLVKTGGVLKQWHDIDSKYKFPTPKEGDIFIQDHGDGKGHTGFIERIEGQWMYTIEGNTNDTGSREGFEVCRKKRLISSAIGFIRVF